MARVIVLGSLLLSGIGGCATVDLDTLIAHLDQRQVTSCIYLNGAYGPFVAIQAVTATGGASLAACLAR